MGGCQSEAACFGIGGGPAFVLYENPDEDWVSFRTSPTWLERAFFERLGVPHLYQRGDDFESAWTEVTARIDDDDPVILFLDPASLEYLPEAPTPVPPHVAVLVGYDDNEVQLSDAAMETRQTISRVTIADAWIDDRFLDLENEFLVVTRARTTEDGTDAAAAAIRQTATYMLEPLQIKLDARGPGEEGLPALRSFADYIGTWADLPDPASPLRAARRSIDEHGGGDAYRGLYAESIAELGQRTELPRDLADQLRRVGSEWQTVSKLFGDIREANEPRPGDLEEAGSRLVSIADREADIFEAIGDELGRADGRE